MPWLMYVNDSVKWTYLTDEFLEPYTIWQVRNEGVIKPAQWFHGRLDLIDSRWSGKIHVWSIHYTLGTHDKIPDCPLNTFITTWNFVGAPDHRRHSIFSECSWNFISSPIAKIWLDGNIIYHLRNQANSFKQTQYFWTMVQPSWLWQRWRLPLSLSDQKRRKLKLRYEVNTLWDSYRRTS